MMSKYFDQARQAVGHSTQTAVGNRANVQEVLEVTAKSLGTPKETNQGILARCRTVQLPLSSDNPVIFPRNEFAAVALESYRALRTRLLRLQAAQKFRSVVLTSAAASEGKSLTTMNLALCCAQLHDFRVLVIDSDLRTGGLTRLFGQGAGPGLGNVLDGEAKYEDAILKTQNPNLFLLGAGMASHPAPELFSGKRWKDLMVWCGEQFQLVLVDSPPILAVADFEQIITACDGALVVVRALRTQRDMLRKAALRIDPKKLLGVIFNGAKINEQNEYMTGYITSAQGNDSTVQDSTQESEPAQVSR
jgi:capsular exopolysaccharide synthesis family protein